MADRYLWTPADGSAPIDLTDEAAGYSILANGTRGLRSVSYDFATAQYAGVDGEKVQGIRAVANTPTLGLLLEAPDEDTFVARARGLVRKMRPKTGPGTLTVSRPDGTSRSLTCYVREGLEGDEATDVTLPGAWWKLAIKLYAPDPWWYGPSQLVEAGLGAPTLFFPIPPVTLSPGTVQGSFTIDLSDSDDLAYPVWTVTGPGSSLNLTNETTGRAIVVNAALADGEQMVIDTRPGFQSVRRVSDGSSLMGSLATDPALWPLIEDVNQVSALLAGATSSSRISGVFSPRYAGI